MNFGAFNVPDFEEDEDAQTFEEDLYESDLEETFIPVEQDLSELTFEELPIDNIPGLNVITEEMKQEIEKNLDKEYNNTETVDAEKEFLQLIQIAKKGFTTTKTTVTKLPYCYACGDRHDFGECKVSNEEE